MQISASDSNKESRYNISMSEINTNITDLVAHGEHIADDLASLELQLDDKQIEVLTTFVQQYIQSAVETVIDNQEWFE